MPSAFSRLGEKMRQTLDLKTPKDWKPTSNARNKASLAEARAFAQIAKRMLKDWNAMQKATDAALTTVKVCLSTKLPSTVEDPAKQLANEQPTVGGGMSTKPIEDSASHLRQQLQVQVIAPLSSWLSAYKSIKAKMDKLEEMRLDVDTKRRDYLTYAEKLEKASEKDAPALQEKKTTAESKMQRLDAAFMNEEAEVFRALELLCKDTAAMKGYNKACLSILQSTFNQASSVFDGHDTSEATGTSGDAPSWYATAKANAGAGDTNYDSE